MFVDSAYSRIDPNIFVDNLEQIRLDYLHGRDMGYLIDYSHEYDLTADPDDDFIDFDFKLTEESPWKVCPLVFNRKTIKILPRFCSECFTTKLILSQPVLPVLAVFSILEPDVDLEPHSDGDERIDKNYLESSVIKYHFSLDIPDSGESALVVDNEKRLLSNGDLNLFDEKQSLHYAYNHSKHRRGVLIVSYIKDEVLTQH